MPRPTDSSGSPPLHVSLVAIPEAVVSTLTGIFDVMSAFPLMFPAGHAPLAAPFQVELVGLRPGPLDRTSVVSGTSVSGTVDLGGRGNIKKKQPLTTSIIDNKTR